MKCLGNCVNICHRKSWYSHATWFANFQEARTLRLPCFVYASLTCLCQIRDVITAQGIRIYILPIETDDEAGVEHARILIDAIPVLLIGSTEDAKTLYGRTVKG